MKLIDKDALVAEIDKLKGKVNDISSFSNGWQQALRLAEIEIDTLEVKEVGISIPNIDDTLKEEGLDPESKEAKIFKESYYTALEKLKAQKGKS